MFLAATPVPIVKEFEPTYASEADASAAVDDWLATVARENVAKREFQDFKATARRIDDEAHPTRQADQWWWPLD